MSGPDTHPTPALGMAAVTATSEAKPSDPGEASKPLSSDPTEKLLAAIEEVRDEAREREQRTDDRIARVERQLVEVTIKTDGNTKLIGEQAEAITRVASAAAKAADMALDAKQQVARAPDETTKLVESALRIHGASIAFTVDAAVKTAVSPIREDVDSLKTDGEKQSEAVGAIINELGLEDRVELGREVKPGEKKPTRTLQKMARENKAGTGAALVTLGILIVKLVLEMLKN